MNTKLKLLLALAIAGVVALQSAVAAKPGKPAKPGKEHTLSGEAKCAKCALHESETCQTVVVTQNKKGKSETVYLDQNDVAKNFHDTICKEPKKVSVTGTLGHGEGKKAKVTMAATKIELAK